MRLIYRQEDREWLSKNLPNFQEIKDDYDEALDAIDLLLAIQGFDEDYELTAFGRKLEAMRDRIYLDNLDKEE